MIDDDIEYEYFEYELSFVDRVIISKLRVIMRDNDNQKTMEKSNILIREVRI